MVYLGGLQEEPQRGLRLGPAILSPLAPWWNEAQMGQSRRARRKAKLREVSPASLHQSITLIH
jgi:hypothetical protein